LRDLQGRDLLWLYTSFSGRVDRKAYALAGMLLYLVRLFPAYQIISAGGDPAAEAAWGIILLLVNGAAILAQVALTAKRFHDFGMSGWFSLVFVIGDIIVFLGLCLFPGTPGPNRFGNETNSPG